MALTPRLPCRRPSNPTKSVPIAVLSLARLLKEREVRVLFFKAGGVTLLAPLLKNVSSASNVQLLYETALCLWQLSYHPPAAEAIVTAGALWRRAVPLDGQCTRAMGNQRMRWLAWCCSAWYCTQQQRG